MKIYPVGVTDRRTDGQTDMTKLTVAFRNVANASKITESKIYSHKQNFFQFIFAKYR